MYSVDMTTSNLLAELFSLLDTTPQSAETLAERLGISAEEVRSHLAPWQGGPVTGQGGYALRPGTPASRLVQAGGILGRPLVYVPQTDSTQNEVLRQAVRWQQEGRSAHGLVVVADDQTQGRGRRGHAWQSSMQGNVGQGLLLSILLHSDPQLAQNLTLLPLACGVAVQAACGVGGLKWPNDLLRADGRKMGGMLLEAEWSAGQVQRLVLGIGLNVLSAPPGAAALSELTAQVNRAQLLQRLLSELEHWLWQSAEHILAAWRRVNLTLGQQVRVQLASEVVEGQAVDIGPGGELVVETSQGRRSISGGEVELVGTVNPLTIRPATPADALQAAELILAANGELAWHLTGTQSAEAARRALAELFGHAGHRLSYSTALIAERAGEVLGLALAYPGEDAVRLDQPLRQRLQTLGRTEQIVSEGLSGEYYLDTLAVSASARGQGVGSALLQHLQQQGRRQGRPLGLLVEQGNAAQRLYERLGFVVVGEQRLAGHSYVRMRWQV